jgi:hypothetical protein
MRGQRNAVLNHLKSGKSITSREAYDLYGATRLSAIIHDLRCMGYTIHTILVDGKTRFGDSCKYAKYILGSESEEN